MALVYLGLGSNLGDRAANLAAARNGLGRIRDTVLLRNASTYETPPVGGAAGQGMYLNSVSLVETFLEPAELLRELLALERRIGRIRENETARWGPRVIDIDILLWGDLVRGEGEPIVPHPRLAERAFVLLPLAELDGDAPHPVLGLTVRELLRRTDWEHEGIRRLPL